MSKRKIPTYDPYTGELNPYYEELTGKPNPLSTVKIINMPKKEDKNLEKMPNQKWHQIISFVKSAVRIVGYLLLPFDLMYATIVLVISEVIGIGEELV